MMRVLQSKMSPIAIPQFILQFRLLLLTLLVFFLGGCVVAPTPPGGAPVVDRTGINRPPQPRPQPQVEVRPLPRTQPIISQQPRFLPDTEEPFADNEPRVVQPPPTPAPPPQPEPAEISRQGNQAVVALLDSASNYVQSGELDKAAASLERALRIEPRNASIWYDLAQIRLHQRQYKQAESMASKSNSLAARNKALQARNWRLIALARRAVGDNSGADAADAQAVALGG